MDVAEKSRNVNKHIYKVQLLLLRVVPYILFIGNVSSITLSYFGIEREFLSMLFGVSVTPWVFILVSSYAFRYCKYHRLMIWYCLVTETVSWIDYYLDIPISDNVYFIVLFVITGLFLFCITYCRIRNI